MAFIKAFKLLELQIEAAHKEAEATYSWVKDSEGRRCLQIDTCGSADRAMVGKKSQSLRLSPEAIGQLRIIIGQR